VVCHMYRTPALGQTASSPNHRSKVYTTHSLLLNATCMQFVLRENPNFVWVSTSRSINFFVKSFTPTRRNINSVYPNLIFISYNYKLQTYVVVSQPLRVTPSLSVWPYLDCGKTYFCVFLVKLN
jgi:hypothetical protein